MFYAFGPLQFTKEILHNKVWELDKRRLLPQTRLGSIPALPLPSCVALAHHIHPVKFCFLICAVGITNPTHRATVLAAREPEVLRNPSC